MRSKDERPGPLLVAVWPGLGQVALTAGYYLMSRLHMHETRPLPAQDLFDVDQVDIEDGIVRTARLPKTRIFLWEDPDRRQDIIVLIGEAQPPAGKLVFCERLLDYAERLGAKEVYTFAALATDIDLRSPSRVFGVATHAEGKKRLEDGEVPMLAAGHLSGLNGILLGVAAQRGWRGLGLLGEMPALMTPVPFAKASAAVLGTFSRLTGIRIELKELEDYGRAVEDQLATVIERLRKSVEEQQAETAEEKEPAVPDSGDDGTAEADRRRIELLFAAAALDRSRTFELKRELDRLGVFEEYENRFLDLFRKSNRPDPD